MARPRTVGARFWVSLTLEADTRLEELAAARGETKSEYVRRNIERSLGFGESNLPAPTGPAVLHAEPRQVNPQWKQKDQPKVKAGEIKT